MVSLWILLGVIAIAVVYLAFGGRALFGGDEHPDRLIGTRVQLGQLESGPKGVDPQQPALPPAVVERFIDGVYVLQFERPVLWLERTETYATVASRSKGYPVSLAASWWRRTVWVSGRFGSGEAFLGMLRIIALALCIAGTPAVVATQSQPEVIVRKLVDAAVAQTRSAVTYDGSKPDSVSRGRRSREYRSLHGCRDPRLSSHRRRSGEGPRGHASRVPVVPGSLGYAGT